MDEILKKLDKLEEAIARIESSLATKNDLKMLKKELIEVLSNKKEDKERVNELERRINKIKDTLI